jgi:hypothetical protein
MQWNLAPGGRSISGTFDVRTGGSEPDARGRRLSVRGEDLEELYLLVQGAPFANTVLDAKDSLAQNDLEGALRLIEASEARYRQSKRRILRQEFDLSDGQTKSDLQQARRLKQRQERCRHVLAAFEDVMSSLRRMIRLRGGGRQTTDASTTREFVCSKVCAY